MLYKELEVGRTMNFPRNSRQQSAIDALCVFVFDPNMPPPAGDDADCEYDGRLDQVLFEILESFFYQNLDPTRIVGCPTDFLMMLLWLKADGSGEKASAVTHDCSIVQYWAKTTVVHTLRLALRNHSKYVPIKSSMTNLTDEIITDDVSSRFTKYVTISQAVSCQSQAILLQIAWRTSSLHPSFDVK
jgi:hypothetical protein